MDKTRFDKMKLKNWKFCQPWCLSGRKCAWTKFVISATLFTHTRQAGLTDDLSASINYGEVSHIITQISPENILLSFWKHLQKILQRCCSTLFPVWNRSLKIEKPWAPVGLPLKTVSVEITRNGILHTLLLALLWEIKLFIDNGIRGLKKQRMRIEAVSDYLVTEPYGVTMDEFLNGSFENAYLLSPEELLERLHQLEQEANRERIIHWGPRTLDLDILFYDQEIIDTADLHIPHPDMQNRDFVLAPMNQIAPYLRHPVLNQTISQLLNILLCR